MRYASLPPICSIPATLGVLPFASRCWRRLDTASAIPVRADPPGVGTATARPSSLEIVPSFVWWYLAPREDALTYMIEFLMIRSSVAAAVMTPGIAGTSMVM